MMAGGRAKCGQLRSSSIRYAHNTAIVKGMTPDRLDSDHHSPSVWPWPGLLTSLYLSFLIYRMVQQKQYSIGSFCVWQLVSCQLLSVTRASTRQELGPF